MEVAELVARSHALDAEAHALRDQCAAERREREHCQEADATEKRGRAAVAGRSAQGKAPSESQRGTLGEHVHKHVRRRVGPHYNKAHRNESAGISEEEEFASESRYYSGTYN